jgi:hypothetical protein
MAIAFKEWALVCDALGRGEQCVILRKGGIAEGAGGFGFQHKEFFLFPTWFHAQKERVRSECLVLPEQAPDLLTIHFAAAIEWSGRVNDKNAVHRLSQLHVLHDAVIEERFEYHTGKDGTDEPLGGGGKGIHVAFVRIYRLEPPISFPMEKSYGGCRSWVELPEITPGALVSVVSDEEHEQRRSCFAQLLGIPQF